MESLNLERSLFWCTSCRSPSTRPKAETFAPLATLPPGSHDCDTAGGRFKAATLQVLPGHSPWLIDLCLQNKLHRILELNASVGWTVCGRHALQEGLESIYSAVFRHADCTGAVFSIRVHTPLTAAPAAACLYTSYCVDTLSR